MGFTTKEVALKLGVTTQTIINWTDRGLLNCTRTPGGHRRFNPSEIQQFSERYSMVTPDESQSKKRQKSEQVVILSHDFDYARLIKDYLSTCFKGFRHGLFDNDTFKLVSTPFKAAYCLGDSEGAVLFVDVEFLTPELKGELELLKQGRTPCLKSIVALCRINQVDELSGWSAVDVIHPRNMSLSQLIAPFSEIFDASQELDEL